MKKVDGITLIALVITIIVLLILAGVSITAVIGENGIATKANDAKKKTDIEGIKEQISLDIVEVQTTNEGKVTEEDLDSILADYGTVLEKDGKIVVITDKQLEIDITDLVNKISFDDELEEDEPMIGAISFIICGKVFYAEENMTWEMWVADTRYNTCGAKFVDELVWIPAAEWNESGYNCVGHPHEQNGCYLADGNYRYSFDIIQDGEELVISCINSGPTDPG